MLPSYEQVSDRRSIRPGSHPGFTRSYMFKFLPEKSLFRGGGGASTPVYSPSPLSPLAAPGLSALLPPFHSVFLAVDSTSLLHSQNFPADAMFHTNSRHGSGSIRCPGTGHCGLQKKTKHTHTTQQMSVGMYSGREVEVVND